MDDDAGPPARSANNNRPQRAYRGRLSAMFTELDRLLLASRTVYSRNKNKFKKRSRNMILREVTDLLNKIWIDDQVKAILAKSSDPDAMSRVKQEPNSAFHRVAAAQMERAESSTISSEAITSLPWQQQSDLKAQGALDAVQSFDLGSFAKPASSSGLPQSSSVGDSMSSLGVAAIPVRGAEPNSDWIRSHDPFASAERLVAKVEKGAPSASQQRPFAQAADDAWHGSQHKPDATTSMGMGSASWSSSSHRPSQAPITQGAASQPMAQRDIVQCHDLRVPPLHMARTGNPAPELGSYNPKLLSACMLAETEALGPDPSPAADLRGHGGATKLVPHQGLSFVGLHVEGYGAEQLGGSSVQPQGLPHLHQTSTQHHYPAGSGAYAYADHSAKTSMLADKPAPLPPVVAGGLPLGSAWPTAGAQQHVGVPDPSQAAEWDRKRALAMEESLFMDLKRNSSDPPHPNPQAPHQHAFHPSR